MKKPNILFLMCDQLQKTAIDKESQCMTPNFDYLASLGTKFERAYTPNAVCSPARASLMTGLLPHNHGMVYVHHNVDRDQSVLRLDKKHWAMRLAENGYHNAYFGKWHVENTECPADFGWHLDCSSKSALYREKAANRLFKGLDENYSLARFYQTPGYKNSIFYGVTDRPPENRAFGITTSMALEYLDEAVKQEEPWCCFVSVEEPHDPFICGEEAYALYDAQNLELPPNVWDDAQDKPGIYRKAARVWKEFSEREKKKAMACYYASITEIDAQFGRLIGKVEESGCRDNTIIILTTDHGELLGAHGIYCKNFGAFEEVYNVPLIVAGPGIGKGRQTSARVGIHDLCPTILDLTQSEPIPVPESSSFADLLKGCADEKEFQTGYAEYFGGRMILTQRIVWDGKWKFVFNGFDFDELYDLEKDPYEMINLIDAPSHRDVVKRLTKAMWAKIKQTGDRTLLNSHYPILRVAPFGPDMKQETDG